METTDSGNGSPPAGPPPEARSRRSMILRRLLPLLVVVVLATWFFQNAPEETELVYGLGARAQGLEQLAVEIYELPYRQLVRRVEYRYSASAPAPAEQPQLLKLKVDTRYLVDAELIYRERRERISRELTFHGEGRITLPY